MKLKKNSWHYKVYSWFKGGKPQTANLCPYCRTVLLWVPLKFLFAKGKVWKIPVPIATYGYFLFELPRILGIISYNGKIVLYGVYALVAGVTVITSTLIGFIKGIDYLLTKGLRNKMTDIEWDYYLRHNKEKSALPDRLKRKSLIARIDDKLVDISKAIKGSLIWNYLRAKHEKVCPVITFEEETNDSKF